MSSCDAGRRSVSCEAGLSLVPVTLEEKAYPVKLDEADVPVTLEDESYPVKLD